MKRHLATPCLTLIAMVAVISLVSVAATPAFQAETEPMVELSLEQCLRMALEQNLELVSARISPKISEADIDTQQANFDLGYGVTTTHQESTQQATSQFDLTDSAFDTTDIGIDQNLKFGGNYSATFSASKVDQAGPLVTIPTSVNSSIALEYTQPLLKGFGTEVSTERLILANNNVKVSRYDLAARAEQLMEQVELAYWDVVAAREALRIEEFALQRAQELLDQNRRMVDVGSLAPIEITQAEAGVASQEENVIVSGVALLDAEDELRRLMGVPQGDAMWLSSIRNLDAPLYRVNEVELDAALLTAMSERNELKSRRQTVINGAISERVSRRNLRNQLDVTLSYTPRARGFSEFDDSVSGIFEGDAFTWLARVNYRATFGNRAAKAQFARNRLTREQSEVDLANQEQTVRVEVRRAVRAVTSGMKRVEAAQSNVVLQRRKLDAEQKKYENGMSTSFEVLTFQNDLAAAELSEVRARSDYLKSLASLERVKGTLLASRGLTLGN